MSIRGDHSRRKIMDAAQMLFATRGFAAVSMQDICDTAGISRGGLYRHYASTADIFMAIINEEQRLAHQALEEAMMANTPPDVILIGFLRSRINRLLRPETSIDNATAEFAAVSEAGREILQKRAASSVEIVTQMLEHGVQAGVFGCENCRDVALHIMWSLEGMGKHNGLFPIDLNQAEKQLKLICDFIKVKPNMPE